MPKGWGKALPQHSSSRVAKKSQVRNAFTRWATTSKTCSIDGVVQDKLFVDVLDGVAVLDLV